MPTIDEWQAALEIPRTVWVDSSQDLANQINPLPASRRFIDEGGIPKLAVGSPEFDPSRFINVAPVEILAAIGRITTPQLGDLADLSSTWAQIRYIWAIEPTPVGARMCLSEAARKIDFHQKGLLSDEFGLGFAYYIVANCYGGHSPADVSVVLEQGEVPGLEQRYRTQPDYLFRHPQSQYLLVECKGTQGDNADCRAQLHRGLEQVPSIEVDGASLQSYVIGTRLSTDGVSVFIVDPPAKEQSSDGKSRKSRRVEKERLDAAAQVVEAASIYQFVGQFDKARVLLKAGKTRDQQEEIEPVERRIGLVEDDYIGQIQELRYAGAAGKIQVFQGVPESVYELLEHGEYAAARISGQSAFNKATPISNGYKFARFHDAVTLGNYVVERAAEALRATVVDIDGAVTQIEIS